MTALDFSYARPGATALTSVGVTSVGRYLATDGRGINLAELQDYLTHGVSVWFIKENAANGMLAGSVQGIRDATAAQQQLNALGQPNAAVYFTADFDIMPYQFAAADAYLTGVATVIAASRIGIYAGIDYLNHSAQLVTYRWKTAANSFDHGKTANVPVHLVQTLDSVPIPNTDYNRVLIANYGQIGGTQTAGTTGTPIISNPTKKREKMKLIRRSDGEVSVLLPRNTAEGSNWTRHPITLAELTSFQAVGENYVTVSDAYYNEFGTV